MKKSFFLGGFLAFCIILISNINFGSRSDEKILEVQDNLLIRVDENGNNYETIVEGKVTKVDFENEGILKTYNAAKNIFVFLIDGQEGFKLEIIKDKKGKVINLESDIETIEISPNGEFLLFKETEKNNYNIYDFGKKEVLELKEEILPSKNMIRFLEDGRLVFYGVRAEDKKNAIFLYDIRKKEYSLIKEVDGFIDYIEVLRDYEIIILKSNLSEEKELLKLNLVSKKIESLSLEVEVIYDGEFLDNKFYFLGKRENNSESIYSIDLGSKKIRRLTFNFPENINFYAGFEIIEGELYFDGYENSIDEGNIYRYNPKDNSVNLVSTKKGKYVILEKSDKFWNLSDFFCLKN
ncbi:MAG: hypothetical protein ACRDD2_05035 [Sarcina sp.]